MKPLFKRRKGDQNILSPSFTRSIIGVVIVGVILFIPVFIPIRLWFQGTVSASGTGLTYISRAIFRKKADILEENIRLADLNKQLSVEQSELFFAEASIRQLESMLAYAETVPDVQMIAARIISRSTLGDNTIIIDKGARDGVMKSNAIIINEGHLIGIVDEVREFTSTILLLESEDSAIPGLILSGTHYDGMVVGKDGFAYEMLFIEQESSFDTGSVVVTSGSDGVLPSGLVIGAISSIDQDPSSPFIQATIEPMVNHVLASHVLIIPRYAQ